MSGEGVQPHGPQEDASPAHDASFVALDGAAAPGPPTPPIEAVPFSAQQFPMEEPAIPILPHRRRLRSPGLKWYKQYDGPDCFQNGRVLVIDYIKQEQTKSGMRKVAAQEFDSIHGLKHLYASPEHVGEPLLRVIHCQNAAWAIQFLLRKFNINSRDELVGTDFGKWVKWKRPEKRGGKPYLNGKTWKATHDPWRGISRSSFGLDYLKHYRCPDYHDRSQEDVRDKMFELNHYDEEDNPKYGCDVFVQRLSCYVQHKDDVAEAPDYPGVNSPYDLSERPSDAHRYFPQLDSLDNGNVIILFENSKSERPWDTLIGARQQWESRWRRLPFYLGVETHDLSSDDSMAIECMKIILSDVWKSIAENWETFLDACDTHISILEEKIYDGPADESRAPELWTNSSMWLKVERLVAIHLALVREMETNLRELTNDPDDKWLEAGAEDMKKITGLVQDDLVKPTANLADLMYKSVGIRDSRHSLQLNTSLWRLSWITFIFLPLTFMSTFFGMNVDIFAEPQPKIKYYFAASVPMMVLVLISWYLLKHSLVTQRQTPYQRGIYEDMFYKLASKYPELWARNGPREAIKPQSMLDRLRWRLILFWNDPRKTIQKNPKDEAGYDDLNTTARLRRYLTDRWTGQLRSFNDASSSSTMLENGVGGSGNGTGGKPDLDDEGASVFSSGVEKQHHHHNHRRPVDVVEGQSTQSAPVGQTGPISTTPYHLEVPVATVDNRTGSTPVSYVLKTTSSGSGKRNNSRPSSATPDQRPGSSRSRSSGRTSQIMVEEEPASWLREASPARRRGARQMRY